MSDNKDSAYHDVIAAEYDAVVVEPRAVPNRLLFAEVDRHVRGGASMLDLGCGTGHMLRRYGDRYTRATGVDHSRGMLDVARRRTDPARVTLVHSDLDEFLAANTERYDLVTCVGVLHHLPVADIGPLLAEIGRRLQPNGVAVLAEPVQVDLATLPAALAAWAPTSLGARLGYSKSAEEPDEGPIDEGVLRTAIAGAGLAIVAEGRMWEMSAQSERPGWLERLKIWWLVRRYGKTGNVLAFALRKDVGADVGAA